MRKPARRPSRRYWESLSDELLLDVDLTTDNPQALDNLVTVLPDGDEEPHVEYKYDLRGTDSDKMRCVHCHQPHLAGYVMLKNGFRFFVGHICGNHIYGEDFDRYTADYNAAVNRQSEQWIAHAECHVAPDAAFWSREPGRRNWQRHRLDRLCRIAGLPADEERRKVVRRKKLAPFEPI